MNFQFFPSLKCFFATLSRYFQHNSFFRLSKYYSKFKGDKFNCQLITLIIYYYTTHYDEKIFSTVGQGMLIVDQPSEQNDVFGHKTEQQTACAEIVHR